jgi:polyhydroxybutyrate depolymerase
MTRIRIALLAACALAATGCSEYQRMEHDGETRRYVLHTPDGYDGEQIPLIVALHGRLGTGRGMARDSGFDALIDAEGFAIVYPDGVQRSWNDGRPGGPAAEAEVDDVGFIDALIEEVGAQVTVDADRIYLVGISNGGMMAQRLACERTATFAAVASVISSMPEIVEEGCSPSALTSMLLMNGTEDPVVPYEGGAVDSDVDGAVLSTAETIDFWRLQLDCDTTPDEETIDELPSDETSIRHLSYSGCAGSTSIELFEIVGGGHTWPGGPQYLDEDTVGRVSAEIDAASTIQSWFSGLVRP